MKVLIVGGGGREHAIAWKVAKSPKVEKLYCAPGNAGIAEVAECVNIGVMEFDKLTAFARENQIDLTIIGCLRGSRLTCLWPTQKRSDLRGIQGIFQGSDEEIRHSNRSL